MHTKNADEMTTFLHEGYDGLYNLNESWRPWQAIKTMYTGKSDNLLRDLENEVRDNKDDKSKLNDIVHDCEKYIAEADEYLRNKKGNTGAQAVTGLIAGGIIGVILGLSLQSVDRNVANGKVKSFRNRLVTIRDKAKAAASKLKN